MLSSSPAFLVPTATDTFTLQSNPTSISPTATDTYTSQSIPTSISPTANDTFFSQSIPTSISYALPTTLSRVISPPGGLPPPPPNTTLVQIGFTYELNYPYVLANSVVQMQIFKYVVPGIAFGMTVDEIFFTMQSLRAYDTTKALSYITTLACFYLPSSHVSLLESQLKISKTGDTSTPLYHNPNPSVESIMAFINPDIPVTPVAALDSSPTFSSTSTSAFDGLSLSSKISIGVMIPVAIIAICLLGLLFWRRRKASRHNGDRSKSTIEETDTDSKIYEMAASTRRFELQEGEHDHELPAAERELRELQGDSRRRQELRGLEPVHELDAGVGD